MSLLFWFHQNHSINLCFIKLDIFLKQVKVLNLSKMKKIVTLFALLIMISAVYGQAPPSFSYQAILKDAAGTVRANTATTVKFEILQGTATGTVVYSETQNTTTTSTGLINLSLGTGTPVTGTFSAINWSTGSYFLKITIDGVAMGTSQLLSVPYALYSDKSGNGFSGSYNDLTSKPALATVATTGSYADLTSKPDLTAINKMTVTSTTDVMDEPLFEVKNKNGQTVFAVYNEGVRIYVDNGTAKGGKGGFAIGGFDNAKAGSQDYFVVAPDSIRMYVEDVPAKGTKGGFAIGTFSPSKGLPQDLLVVNSDSIRAYIDTNTGKGAKGGFAIGGFAGAKGLGDEYLRVTRDSTRVYINNTPTKAPKGGFAIGGFSNSKGENSEYLLINPDSTNFYVRELADGSSSTFNILSLDNLLGQKSLMRAGGDTIDMNSVLNLQNDFNVYGDIGYTGAVDKIYVPELTTTQPSGVTETGAESGGTIINDGGAAIIVSGIVWGTSPAPTTALPTKTTDGTTIEGFTSIITGLTASTTYYVRAYATNSVGTAYGNEILFVTLGAGGTVADFEGNIYNTVVIGAQTWMATNLKTTKFNDGSQIPKVVSDMDWQYLSTPAYAWYDADSLTYHNTGYGALYNWYTVQTGNLCPIGWHVPTLNDFTDLSTFLGDPFSAGGMLKEAGTTHWFAPNTDASNSSLFTALPAGMRVYMGPYMGTGETAQFWSSTMTAPSEANSMRLTYTTGEMLVSPELDQLGLSVRCLQGSPVLTLPEVSTAFPSGGYIDAMGGGEVISDGGSPVTARGVGWSQTPNPTLQTGTVVNSGTGVGVFVSSITGLQPGTTYYVKAFATNSVGTSYGFEEVFSTMAAK